MSARRVCTIAVLGFLPIAAAPCAWAGFSAAYPVRYLHPRDALALLQSRVSELNEDGCKIDSEPVIDPHAAGQRGIVHVTCKADDVRAKVEKALAEIDVPPPTQRFHIVILEASRREGSAPALPASEQKALDDFKKVMTYKSFKVQGETIVQLDDNAKTQVNDDYDLELVLDLTRADATSISVRRFCLTSKTGQPLLNGAVTYPAFFDTAFSVKRGETVVLGSSSTSDTARVVLVTALP